MTKSEVEHLRPDMDRLLLNLRDSEESVDLRLSNFEVGASEPRSRISAQSGSPAKKQKDWFT